MWKYFNNNPVKRNVGDCSVRAVSVALGWDWEKAYCELCSNGYYMADMPSSNSTIGALLRQHGFHKEIISDSCSDCYTIEDFCKENPRGLFVVGTGNHIVTVVDGDYYDSWESGNEVPIYYWRKVK